MISKLICKLGGECVLDKRDTAKLFVYFLKRKTTEQEDLSKILCIKCGKEYTFKQLSKREQIS